MLVIAMLVLSLNRPLAAGETLVLIDDFRAQRSALGTSWQGFTDRVMGGLSDMQAGYREKEGSTVLAVTGQVRLENNGGFIQVRLPLDPGGNLLDVSQFEGIRVSARAIKPGAYYIHLRSADTRRPWSYYRAPLELGQDWAEIDLPWSAFEPRSLHRPLDPSRLLSVAVVAYGAAFDAELEIRSLAWLAR